MDLKFGSDVGEAYVWQIKVGTRMRVEMEDGEQTIADLADSIQGDRIGVGLIQTLAVERLPEPDGEYLYQLLCGGRRTLALLSSEIKSTIPIRIYPPLTPRERERIEIFENIKRKNFSWKETNDAKARLHAHMVEEYGEKKPGPAISDDPAVVGWSVADTAKVLGLNKGQLYKDLALAEAVKAFPALGQLPTKQEAAKTLEKTIQATQTAAAVRQVEALHAGRSESSWLKVLADSYVLNDFFEGVKNLPDESFDLVECDPPYAIKELNPEVYVSDKLKQFEEVTADLYPEFIRAVARECFRLLRPNSWILCWFAQHPHGPVTYDALIEAGFEGMRMPAIWDKEVEAARVMYPDYYLGRATEQFYYLRKGSPRIIKQGHIDIFRHSLLHRSQKVHPTEKPLPLMQEIFATFLGPAKSILVPFLGSGNSLLAAHLNHCTAMGFDKSELHRDGYLYKLYNKDWNNGAAVADKQSTEEKAEAATTD